MLELFDLQAMVERGAADPGIAALRPLIHAAISMHSVGNDLKRVAEMLEACKALSTRLRDSARRGEDASRGEAATVQALFAQAVLLYTRATHSKGAGRNKLQITNHLDREMRALHDRMTTLRDTYLAHFEDAEGWEEHRAVLALDLDDAKMALSYPHAAAYIRPEDAATLERLLAAALPIAFEAASKVSNKLNMGINELFESRADFLETLRRTRFDPAGFFDEDEIQPYLDSVGAHEGDPVTTPRVGARIRRAKARGRS